MNWSHNSFKTSESIRNNLKARRLCVVRAESERRRTASCHVWTAASMAKEEFFLHRMVTGDEKWMHYDNFKRRRFWSKPSHSSTSEAKPNIPLFCIWWDQLGLVFYELLKQIETTTGDRYRLQLTRLCRSLKKKRPLYEQRHYKGILQHNNTRLHLEKRVKIYLETL